MTFVLDALNDAHYTDIIVFMKIPGELIERDYVCRAITHANADAVTATGVMTVSNITSDAGYGHVNTRYEDIASSAATLYPAVYKGATTTASAYSEPIVYSILASVNEVIMDLRRGDIHVANAPGAGNLQLGTTEPGTAD